ncbi:50S ribosomal protein L30 [Candidatus Woesearchaeota archaeon]|nr:MAG: 50S ribosomal protein L30 [Candidatus Woesearchaeota archaeon]
MSETEIKKLVAEGKAIIGTDETLKGLRKGAIAKVYVSANTPEMVKEDIERYAKLSGAQVVHLELSNDQLGDVCKKNFPISILSVKK